MRDVSCKLLSKIIKKDKIGAQKEETTEREVPLIRIEDIYATEYYKANELGHKPNLRIIISVLNYNNEKELIYMDKIYSIVRTQEVEVDELALICERKVKNVKSN